MTLLAEPPVRVGTRWFVVVVDTQCAASHRGQDAVWVAVSKHPVAVVCVAPDGTWAGDLRGEPLDVEQTCAAVVGMGPTVAELQSRVPAASR